MKNFEITVRGDTPQELAKNLLQIAKQYQTTPAGGDASASDDASEVENVAPKPSGKTPVTPKDVKKVEPKKVEPKAEELDYKKDVAPKVIELAEKKGREYTVELLSKFGVEKATKLTPDQYPEVIVALDAALAED